MSNHYVCARASLLSHSNLSLSSPLSDIVRLRWVKYRTHLNSGNEQRQLFDLVLEILPINDSGKIKHFRALVYFGPKPVFQQFFGFP